jgi:hypothetical protein
MMARDVLRTLERLTADQPNYTGLVLRRIRVLPKVGHQGARRFSWVHLAPLVGEQKPFLVARGSQKDFEDFMKRFSVGEGAPAPEMPDVTEYKRIVARAILYNSAQKLVRKNFTAFQANVTAYTVSVIAARLGSTLNLDQIWQNQAISTPLAHQILTWATEVNDRLHATSGGRMISEWSKKAECWELVRTTAFSKPAKAIPEVR